MPSGCTGVSLPLISTCGTWPTEKLRSLILSETNNIRSIMGGKSKKLIGRRSRRPGPARPSAILAYNCDKHKEIMLAIRAADLRTIVAAFREYLQGQTGGHGTARVGRPPPRSLQAHSPTKSRRFPPTASRQALPALVSECPNRR